MHLQILEESFRAPYCVFKTCPLKLVRREKNCTALKKYAFYIGKTEVTKGEWDRVYIWAVQNGYTFDYTGQPTGAGGQIPVPPSDGHPIVGITWFDAVKWCNAVSEMENRMP